MFLNFNLCNFRIKNLGIFLFLLISSSTYAEISYKEVTARGSGKTYENALSSALETAVGKVNGISIATAKSSQIQEVVKNEKVDFIENFSQNTETISNGVVKSYRITKLSNNPDTGRLTISIVAVVPIYKHSSTQLKRRKIAVAPIAVDRDYLSNKGALKFAATLSTDLQSYLTQIRKFAVLDRSFQKFTNAELESYKSGNYPIEDSLKIGNRVGAEYLVIIGIREFSIKNKNTDTGNTDIKFNKTTVPISIELRIIDIVSGQVKFAYKHIQTGRITKNFGLASFSKQIATNLGERINFAIFPITIISRQGDMLTLNQGGETVKVGKSYRLVKLGKPLKDPYTGESLGKEEIEVGMVEIKNKTDRISSAKLVSGFIDEGEVFNTLRIRPMKTKPKLLESIKNKKFMTIETSKENKKADEKDDW